MKSEIIEKNGCTVKLLLEVSEMAVAEYEKTVIDEFQRVAQLKGFRAGKAPLNMVIKSYKSKIKSEVLSRALPRILSKAMEELKLRPLGEPVIDNVEYELGSKMTFRLYVENFPEFEVSDYKGMELKRTKVEVLDSEVDEYVKEMAEYSAPFETITDRELKINDFAIIDFEIFTGDRSVEKKEGFWIKVLDDHKDDFIKGICSGVKGMKISETREIKLVLPDTYKDKDAAGKEANITVVLKEIRIKLVPVIDDEYIKNLKQGFETLDAYKADIKNFILKQKEQNGKKMIDEQINKNLILANRFDLPQNILKRRIEENYQEHLSNLKSRGVSQNVINEQSEEIIKDINEHTANQFRLEFIYSKIIEKEGLKTTEDEYQKALAEESAKYGMTKDSFERYIKTKKSVDLFKYTLLVDKIYDLIKESSKFIDVENN